MIHGERRIERFLVDCVQGHDVRPSASALGDAVTSLPAVAAYQGVAGFAYAAIANTGALPPMVESDLHDESMRASMLRQQVHADLCRIVRTLDEADIPFVVLKGPILDKWVYRHHERRSYNDLDLLVEPSHLGRAVHALEEDGSTLLDQNWDLLLSMLPGEVHLAAPMGTMIDLHWHVLNDAQLRTEFRIDSEALLGHATRVPIDDLEVPTLEPEPMLIHVALHACLSGADRLVWIKDVEQCATVDGLDWDDVVGLSEQWGVSNPLALVLTRAEVLLGLDVPAPASRRLGVGRGYCRLSGSLDHLLPVVGDNGGRSLGRLVARAARRTGWDSLGALARKSGTALVHRFRDGDRISRDATDPGSTLYPSGTDADRDRFFRYIAAPGAWTP